MIYGVGVGVVGVGVGEKVMGNLNAEPPTSHHFKKRVNKIEKLEMRY